MLNRYRIPLISTGSSIVRSADAESAGSRNYTFTQTQTGSLQAIPQQPSFRAVSPNAATRCIAISKVAENIIKNFLPGHRMYLRPAELLRVMLVCKALFYPASTVLWSHMYQGLNPLFDLLDLVYVVPRLLIELQERPTEQYVSVWIQCLTSTYQIEQNCSFRRRCDEEEPKLDQFPVLRIPDTICEVQRRRHRA